MSEFINENPDILDESQLPKRKTDDYDETEEEQDLFGTIETTKNPNIVYSNSNGNVKRAFYDNNFFFSKNRKSLLKLVNKESSVYQNLKINNSLLLLQKSINKKKQHDDHTVPKVIINNTNKVKEELVDSQEIYDLISHISDPEHPLSLGQLSVIQLSDIEVINKSSPKTCMGEVIVRITPTITHCSLATLIGLGVRVRLDRSLSPRFRITILLKKGTHQSENQVNKQLNDKERVAAACENDQLLGVVSKMLSSCK